MLIVDDLAQVPDPLDYPVVSIGSFDGIHRGHQAIIQRLLEVTKERKGTSIVLSFSPHPQRVIAPATAPALLQTPAQREQILQALGIDVLFRLPFNRKISLLSPERFVHEILLAWRVDEIVVGTNFRFGHKRSGDFELLRRLCAQRGIEVHGIEPVRFRNVRISSTRVRGLLLEGRVSLARRMLARPYEISGTVVRGAGNGVLLGFPTANLAPENELAPAVGVYAGLAHIDETPRLCVINVGFRPTLHWRQETPVVEAHLLDFERDLYGSRLTLQFCLRLRGEKKFDSIDSLKKQIAKDVGLTRKYAAHLRPVLR